MKNTQNARILQVKNETLVVGVDIAKQTHYARAFTNRGVELGKLLKFENTTQGFISFDSWLDKLQQDNNMTEVIVGFEPTGHYWFNLADHIKACGYQLAIVNPYHVKTAKELDDNNPSKSDRKDAKTIAMLVKDGRYRDVYIPEGTYQELREFVVEYERIQKKSVALKNQVNRWLDIYFPEFTSIFKDWTGKAAWLTLKHYSTPQKVVEAGAQEVLLTWRKEMQRPSLKRAERLLNVANNSIGRKIGTKASVSSLQFMVAEYELYKMQLEHLIEQMEECLHEIPNAYFLLEVKGLGILAVAIVVSELGDIARFKDPRQLIKYAGLNLRENSSGKHKGKTTISKRGRKRLRHGLFQAMIPMLATNAEFRLLHKRNVTRGERPLNKMQSIIALCSKLLRITFAILTKGVRYDPEKLIINTAIAEVA